MAFAAEPLAADVSAQAVVADVATKTAVVDITAKTAAGTSGTPPLPGASAGQLAERRLPASAPCLALGDSVTAGFGLEQPQNEGFAALLQKEWGGCWQNEGVNGATASQLRALVSGGGLDASIKEAEIITVTVGGNDLLQVLYGAIANRYNRNNKLAEDEVSGDGDGGGASKSSGKALSGADVGRILSNTAHPKNLPLLLTASRLIGEGYPQLRSDVLSAVQRVKQELLAAVAELHRKNEDAVIIVTTQYNPYQEMHLSFFSDIPLGDFMEAGVKDLNAAILEGAVEGGYLVADVYTAFAKVMPQMRLCNASAEPLNLDVHPNAAGHRMIAEEIGYLLDKLPPEGEQGSADLRNPAKGAAALLCCGTGVCTAIAGEIFGGRR